MCGRKLPKHTGVGTVISLCRAMVPRKPDDWSKLWLFREEEIKNLAKFVKYSHWAIFENIEIAELTANSFRMRTLDCSEQSAAKKRGMEYYGCRTGALQIRSGFFKGVNLKAKVQRFLSPPEAGPAGTQAVVPCEWLISLELDTS